MNRPLHLFIWTVFVSGYGDENVLYTALVNTVGYNNKVRPKLDHTQAVTVSVEYELFSIVDFVSELDTIRLYIYNYNKIWSKEIFKCIVSYAS